MVVVMGTVPEKFVLDSNERRQTCQWKDGCRADLSLGRLLIRNGWIAAGGRK